MYQLYKEECESADPPIVPVKECMYHKIFCEEYNLSFFHPRKDQCGVCIKYKQLSGEEKEKFCEEYEAHIARKAEAQDAKKVDKEWAASDPTFVSATFDLESVLQIPSSEHSLMYYSRKICVYNLCVYNAKPPNEAYCYCWSEIDGKKRKQWHWNMPVEMVEPVTTYSNWGLAFLWHMCGTESQSECSSNVLVYPQQKSPSNNNT